MPERMVENAQDKLHPRRSRRAIGDFAGDKSGASALEFALVATPFLLLIFAALEVGLVYFANFTLENAVSRGARLVRTGQAQTQQFSADKFKAEVCKSLGAPLSCSELKLDVRKFTDFSSAELTNPLDGKGGMKSNFSYEPGLGGDIVVVRAFYEWTLAAKLPKEVGLSNMANGNRLLVATVAFRNEPFPKP
jgi:Flp pilus assembly protein TadG